MNHIMKKPQALGWLEVLCGLSVGQFKYRSIQSSKHSKNTFKLEAGPTDERTVDLFGVH